MENNTFIVPAVAELLEEGFVEARLHTDTHPEFSGFQEEWLDSVALPIYVIVNPDADLDFTAEGFDSSQIPILMRKDGVTIADSEFVKLLEKGQAGRAQ